MVDRSVSIALEAKVSGFVAGVRTAQASLTGFTAELEKSAKKRQALTELGTAAGRIGLVAGAGIAVAVAAAANFDQAMSRVQGATGESAKSMELLRTAAINAGRDTVFSATDAASAEEEMAKAGVKTADILGGGLTGALDLASAGTLDVGTAAGIAATTMNQFGLAGSDVTHIADVLAATAGKAQGDVSDMAEALKYVGPVASQMGVSLEQTAGSIGLLASQGILGSQAGTSLRGMLTALTSPSKSAAKEMDTLGISMYDAKGNFVGLDGIAGQLHDKMSGLSNATRDQALGQIFGNQQITAARILYAGGSQAVDSWTKKVDDSGYAAHLAGTKMNNLKGDLEQLKGSLETALIGTGEGAQGPLRGIVRGLTDVVNAYSNLPGPAKDAAGAAAGFIAVAGGGIWAVTKMVNGISTMRDNLSTLGGKFASTNKGLLAMRGAAAVAGVALLSVSQNTAGTNRSLSELSGLLGGAAMGSMFGPWGAAIGAAAGLAGSFAKSNSVAAAHVDDLTASLDQQTGALTANTREAVANALEQNGVLKAAQDLGVPLDVVTKAAEGNSRAIQYLNIQLKELMASAAGDPSKFQGVKSFQELLGNIGAEGGAVGKARDEWKRHSEATKGAASAMDGAGRAAQGASGSIKGMGGALDHAASAGERATTALKALSGFLDKRDAMRNYEASLDALSASIKKNGHTFDITTDKGRANQAALDGIASAAAQVADKMKGASKVAFMKQAAADLRARAGQLHLTSDQIQEVINHLKVANATNAKPDVKPQGIGQAHRDIEGVSGDMHSLDKQTATPKVRIDTSGAVAAINSVLSHLAGLDRYTATPHVTTIYGHRGSPGAVTPAAGGHITGPGTGTSDSIPAMVSNGEYVIKTAAVEKYGVNMMHRINSMQFSGGGSVGRQMTWSGGDSGSVRLAGPVEIRGRVDLDTGRLIGTMHAIADQHIDDDHSFSRAMAGRLS